ncbi:Cleavage and polyadenylation specificity factor subunit 4, partial [Coelomomyces lativittatus]
MNAAATFSSFSSTSSSHTANSSLDDLISLDKISLAFEEYVIKELGVSLSLQKAPICRNYIRGFCPLGDQCSSRHPTKGKTVVCKHWLRGLCKKGDTCEFLHEYNMRKMPECWFFSKYKECSNAECIYLHIDPATKIKPCPWYARGFCKRGPECNHKHIKKPLCLLYVTGFCPRGPDCPDG